MHVRGPQAVLLASLIAVAPALAIPAFASSTGPATTVASDTVAAAPKVVIVVGAVQGSTASYRAKGDQIYAEAIKYTPNVTRIYSPNATWATVKAAAQGASVFIYLGHGYGYPSPYRAVLSPSVQDGMEINGTGGIGDSDLKYYGESLIASDIRFAKNAVVILSGLCYAAGSSESGDPAPSIPVAKERIDNFASGWIKAGARVVISDTFESAFAGSPSAHFTQIEVGQRLDDFDLLIELGSGAFARVFLARQLSLQQLVAVKISANRGNEPQTLAQLDHDYIVRVFDQRILPDRDWRLLYMQYLPGGTLLDLVQAEFTVGSGHPTPVRRCLTR